PDAGIEEGLLPDPVEGQGEAVPRLVPDRDGEHPSDRRKGLAPQLFVEMGNEVHIGTRLQPVTAALEPGELLDVVIQFAVAHDGDGAVFVIDRLIAAGQIDDGQATHAQHGLVPVVPAHAIGAAVRQQADRVPDAGPGEGAIDTHESGYATHDRGRAVRSAILRGTRRNRVVAGRPPRAPFVTSGPAVYPPAP